MTWTCRATDHRNEVTRFSGSGNGIPAYSTHILPGSFQTLVLLLSGLALFRVTALAVNGTDLFTDESQYWSWSREPAFGYYSKPPLIAWIIAATTPLCGDSEFCVRLPSVFIHLATSLVVYIIGLRLFSERAGFWSAITFATLPGISMSSGIISTDVPLLFAWAIALLAFAELVVVPSLAMSALLGIALGAGLNAKYAMAYFVPCAAIYFLLVPERAAILRQPFLWISAAIAALLIVPNLLWNAANSFATFSHTADNANWSGSLFHPGKALEFLGAQFGVFGPILFGALLVIVWRSARVLKILPQVDRLLIAFSLPIILAVTVQALLSRSLANWAAPAYVAATILVVSVLMRRGAGRWLAASLTLNAGIGLVLAMATWQAGHFRLPGGDPFARTLGNRELANVIRAGLDGNAARQISYDAVLTDDRDNAAALLYYGRDFSIPIYAWRESGAPRNHFELTRPFDTPTPGPVLLVSRRPDGSGIPASFRFVLPLGPLHVPAGAFAERTVHIFALSEFKGR